ncbi:lycopene cyclase domain-containing protein [Citricoccus sp. SGAir0253]|uniref:lycopene cyclase domain-containing protein n=1 Tax=Citricoccus sp. SGAir0253 TaxID=2567881 RepID=UPI0010CD1B5A|nr:lycopene cyclase domain-containing protein [Citricoccus sp. SGAir0253]QCU77286.1 lycopene cyclase domain-containing protein [Citricoccus sp. SGAir0253]
MSYLALALVFVGISAAVAAVATWRRRLGARWWAMTAATIAVLAVLTAVFDNAMVAADLFRYDASQLTGWSVGLAPVEDFAWPVAAGLLLPSAWALLRPRDAERDGRPERRPGEAGTGRGPAPRAEEAA